MGEDYDGSSDKLTAAKRAMQTMIFEKGRIDPGDRISIVAFSDDAQCVLPLTRIGGNENAIAVAVQSLKISGGTNLDCGLVAARDMGLDRSQARAVWRVVLLTDGKDGGSPLKTATELKSKGVVIDCIGIGPDPSSVNEPLLRKIASVIAEQARYRFIRDSRTLVQHYTQLAGKTRIA